MDVLSTCIYVHHMSTWCPQNPKRASDPLELELADSCEPPGGAGNETQVLCESSDYCPPPRHLSSSGGRTLN